MAHPWVKAGEKPAVNVPEISIDSPATSVENKAPVVTENIVPKTPYKRRMENPLSPGIGLKEVFDVSNAVHRMEEESHRRRHAPQSSGLHPVDALNTSTRQRQAFMSQLNEEDEDDSSSTSDGSLSSDDDDVIVARLSGVEINIGDAQEETTVKGSEDSQQAQELRLLLQQQQQEYQRAQEEMAHENHQKYLKQQQQAGHSIPAQHISLPSRNQVGPSSSKSNQTISSSASTSTVGSTSTTSTTRRRRAGFELNMNQATLLNRRAKNHPTLSLGSVEQQDSLRQDPPLAV